MREWVWPLLVAVVIVFAGCSSKEPDARSVPGTTDDTSHPGGNDPVTSNGAPPTGPPPTSGAGTPASQGGNHAPIPDVKPSAKSGPAPLSINFTLGASDADGDALSWTFDANSDGTKEDSGTDLPKTVAFSYAQAGTSNATFRVTDGRLESVFVVAVTILEAKPASVVFTGHVDVPDPASTAANECILDIAIVAGAPDNVVGNIHAFPEALDGWHYTFDKPGFWAQFWQGTTAITGSGAGGDVPTGSDQVWVCGKDAATLNTDYVLTISPP
ncbi:MAG: hypothetical protein V4510_12225 [bacterium]